MRRLLHAEPHDPPFGTYETVQTADCKFESTLRLSDRAQAAAGLSNTEYKGEVCSNKAEAENSAARVFWDDPIAQERAAKLEPSRKSLKERCRRLGHNAKRKALYGS